MPNDEDKSKPHSRTAVLIDGDWLIAASGRLQRTIDYRQLAENLHQSFGLVTHLHFFGSFDENNKRHKAFLSDLISSGFVVQTVPITRAAGRTLSKGLDVLLGVTAAALLPVVDQLVLVSGDSDFVPLLEEAKKAGKAVVLLSLPFASAHALLAAATKVVSFENFITGTSFVSSHETASLHTGKAYVSPPDELYVAKGEYVEPYLLVRQLFKKASVNLTIIDPYVNEQIFEMIMLVPKGAKILVITDENKLMPPDYKNYVRKFRLEGRQIDVFHSKDVHDRFIKVDKEWWHSGHTLKDLGTKDSVIKKLTLASRAKADRRLNEYLSSATNLCPVP